MDEYKKYEPIFGSWYLKRLIGKGSFGKVFEITREEFGVTYRAALKVISLPQDEDDVKARMAEGTSAAEVSDYYSGILREIVKENEIMSKLKGNSNIVSYEDHQIIPHDDGIGYDVLIRMELLTPLLDRMIERKLEEREVVKLGIDICKALEICHKKNIIHRDIKPQNIFISETGDFKLGDFGIARTMEKTTGGMSQKGTYKYMAPEVFRGEDYGSTVDLYSLGIVLFSLMNGNRGPFLPPPPAKVDHNDEEQARMRRFRGEPIPSPQDAGLMFSYIIKKACDPDPAKRYRTAEQMRRDLESYLANYSRQPAAAAPAAMPADETVALGPQTYAAPYVEPRDISGRKNKKRIWPLISACMLLVALIAGGAIFFINRAGTPEEVDLAALMEEPQLGGFDGGYGTLLNDIGMDSEKRDAFLKGIKNDEKRSSAEKLLDSVVYTADAVSGLSNGDSIKINAGYDASLAESAGLEVIGKETVIKISGLDPLPKKFSGAAAFNGHLYKVVDGNGIYWSEAKAACEAEGGHLVTITSQEEQDFIVGLIEEKGKQHHYWLGGTDEDAPDLTEDDKSKNSWKWITGEPWGYSNWCTGQPNNTAYVDSVHGQDYLEMQMTHGDQDTDTYTEYGTWTDICDSGVAYNTKTGENFEEAPDYNSTKYYGYIIEWEPDQIR